MNLLLCVLNPVSRIFRTLFLYSALFLIVDWNNLGIMCDTVGFEKRHASNLNSAEAEKTHCKHIGDMALRPDCESWSCWESQLRDHFRIEFLNIYNGFRTSVVLQECLECKYYKDIPVMIQLEWHWELEKESQTAIKYCPHRDFKTNIKISIDDDFLNETNSLGCEMVATSFPILSGTQDELIRMLPSLLYGNYLRDFNTNNKYRRNLALYIGCSYIPRILDWEHTHSANPSLKRPIGHLLCYYCTREETIHSDTNDPKSCPAYTTKTHVNNFPLLCKLTTNRTTLPCESSFIPCPLRDKTYSWIYPHLTDMVAQLANGTNLPIADNLDKFNSTEPSNTDSKGIEPKQMEPIRKEINPYTTLQDPYDKKFCILIILIYIFVVLLMVSVLLLICRFYLVQRRRIAAIKASM